jgi:hypothetical protein
MWRDSAPIAAAAATASAAGLWIRRSARGREPGETAFELWCSRQAYVPRARRALDAAELPLPYRRLVQDAGDAPQAVPPTGVPELAGSLFADRFRWIVRAATGPGTTAVLGRAPVDGGGRGALTGLALVLRGHARPPGLRVHATRAFGADVLHPAPDPAATPPLLAGRYVVDADAVPDELVVELLDPALPPLLVECRPRALLVATASTRLQAADIDALQTVAARLRLLLVDDVAAAAPGR